MTMALLIDKLATEKFGNVIQISDRNQSELEKILSQTNNFSNVNPVQFYNVVTIPLNLYREIKYKTFSYLHFSPLI